MRWPRSIEIATRISIPIMFTPNTLTGPPPDGTDAAPSCLADTNVSIKFADEPPEPTTSPSSTTASPTPSIAEEVVPTPDRTFLIRDPDCGKSIAVVDGTVQLHGTLPSNPAAQWTCFEANGWLGFRCRETGNVLGHDGRGGLHAKVSHHRANEWFQVRRHAEGGYLLLVKHREHLWRVDVAGDGRGLVERPEGGMRWEFIAVE